MTSNDIQSLNWAQLWGFNHFAKHFLAFWCLAFLNQGALLNTGTFHLFISTLLLPLLLLSCWLEKTLSEKAVLRVSSLQSHWPTFVLIGYYIVSYLWSSAAFPNAEIAAIQLIQQTVLGLSLAILFDSSERTKILSSYLKFVILASFFLIIFVPHLGLHEGFLSSQNRAHQGNWKGIFYHKQQLGIFSALGFLFFGTQIKGLLRLNISNFLFMGLSILLMIMAQSATSIISLFLALFFGMTFTSFWREKIISKLLSFVNLGIILVLMINLKRIFGLLGKNPDLSGRVPLWLVCGEFFRKHPIWGWGIGGFWKSSAQAIISDLLGWQVPHGHNGYVDTALETGLVGLALLGIFFVSFFSSWIVCSKNRKFRFLGEQELKFSIYFLIFYLVVNFGETCFPIKRGGVFWIICVSLFSNLRRERFLKD